MQSDDSLKILNDYKDVLSKLLMSGRKLYLESLLPDRKDTIELYLLTYIAGELKEKDPSWDSIWSLHTMFTRLPFFISDEEYMKLDRVDIKNLTIENYDSFDTFLQRLRGAFSEERKKRGELHQFMREFGSGKKWVDELETVVAKAEVLKTDKDVKDLIASSLTEEEYQRYLKAIK